MKYTKHWALVNKKTGAFYEVQDKPQLFNSREDARFMTQGFVSGYKVEKVNVTIERKSV